MIRLPGSEGLDADLPQSSREQCPIVCLQYVDKLFQVQPTGTDY